MKLILILTTVMLLPAAAFANTCPAAVPTSCASCTGGLVLPNAQGQCAAHHRRAEIRTGTTCPPHWETISFFGAFPAPNRPGVCNACNFATGAARLTFE